MQCGIEGKMIRSVRMVEVKCFKCRKEGHKCRECLLWIKRKDEKEEACMARPRKAQQEERPACPIKGKVQEKEKKLRRVEEKEAVRPMKGKAQQEE